MMLIVLIIVHFVCFSRAIAEEGESDVSSRLVLGHNSKYVP